MVLGWLTKLVVLLSVLGVLGFDAISLVQAKFQAADRATTAASAAATLYAQQRDVQKAYNAAYATTTDGDTIEADTFTVGSDGSVTLRLHHEATTMIIDRIPQLRHWADAVGVGEARTA